MPPTASRGEGGWEGVGGENGASEKRGREEGGEEGTTQKEPSRAAATEAPYEEEGDRARGLSDDEDDGGGDNAEGDKGGAACLAGGTWRPWGTNRLLPRSDKSCESERRASIGLGPCCCCCCCNCAAPSLLPPLRCPRDGGGDEGDGGGGGSEPMSMKAEAVRLRSPRGPRWPETWTGRLESKSLRRRRSGVAAEGRGELKACGEVVEEEG